MKQLLQQYAAYNFWANSIITNQIQQLTKEQVNAEIVSSFPSLYKTIMHMTEVENIWWERLKLVEHTTPPGWFTGNFDDLSKKLLELSQQWLHWVNTASEAKITHVFAYQNSKNELFKQPVNEVLVHLFNHQTYHRGQIVTMFRQMGKDKITPTDFIAFTRNPLLPKKG